MTDRYTFSGHETFQCKTLWLKKGYDFVKAGNDFNSSDAVIVLGVGKNMVSAIRYWMKAFGLLIEDKLTDIAHYIFDSDSGKDPYSEDLATLWLLHYLIVSTNHASIYKLTFDDFHRERKEFSTEQLQRFVKRHCTAKGYDTSYNENTVKKDIDVLLKNYVLPADSKTNEDYSVLLLELNLIRSDNKHDDESKVFVFNDSGKRIVQAEIFLYAIVDKKGNDKSVSYNTLLDVSRMFCMNTEELLLCIKHLTKTYKDYIVFSDNAGIKQLQFLKDLNKTYILNHYFSKK
jgi:hypothetical protein